MDRAEQTVHWSIIGKSSSDNDLMNADVLTFGRYGYEKLIWAGPGNHDPRALLGVARAGFTFDTGAKYTDFHDGDKVATYGVAAVVAAAESGFRGWGVISRGVGPEASPPRSI